MFHRLCSAIGYLVQKKNIFFSSMEENSGNSSMVSIKIGKSTQDGLERSRCAGHSPSSLPLVEEDGLRVLVGHLCNVL